MTQTQVETRRATSADAVEDDAQPCNKTGNFGSHFRRFFCPLAADTLFHPTMLSVMLVPHIGIHLSHAIPIDERYHCVSK
jgi:hypothetical protein